MRLFIERTLNRSITLLGNTAALSNINNYDDNSYYSSTTVPFTLNIPIYGASTTAATTVSDILVEGHNITNYSLNVGTANNVLQNISDFKTYSDGSITRQIDLRVVPRMGTNLRSATALSLAINGRTDSNLPVRIYRVYALLERLQFDDDGTWIREEREEEDPNMVVYDSLYGIRSISPSLLGPKRGVSYIATWQNRNRLSNVQYFRRNTPNFVIEESHDEFPDRTYRAYFENRITGDYSTDYKPTGMDIGFTVRQR